MRRLIPISICRLCLNKRLYNKFRSYLVLNYLSNGYQPRKKAIRLLISELNISRNTAKSHIAFCIQRGWLGFDNGTIYIRSLDAIRKKEKTTQRASVWLQYKFIKDFKAFCFAALVLQIKKDLRRLQAVEKKRATNQGLNSFYPISGQLLKQRYNISESVSSRLRKRAHELGLLKFKQNLVPFKPQGEILKKEEISHLKTSLDYQISKRLKIVKGVICIQEVILMKSLLTGKNRKESRLKKCQKIES